MESHNYNLIDKVITINDYKFNRNPPQQYGLQDRVVCYFDGYNRKVIPLYIALSFPIIYDNYMGSHEQIKDITITVCPFTLSTAVFEGKFEATQYVQNSCLIITDNLNHTFPIIDSFVYSHENKAIKKFQVDIKILRNVFTEYPDCKYMVLSDNIPVKSILNLKYYENENILFKYVEPSDEFHPKTLVYLIQYISSKDQSIKSTILVGYDANSRTITGYNVVESGVYKYLMNYDDKIKQKLGFVIPTMWFTWKSFYPNAKIIYIPTPQNRLR